MLRNCECSNIIQHNFCCCFQQRAKFQQKTEQLERGLSEMIDGPLGGSSSGDKHRSKHVPGNCSAHCTLCIFINLTALVRLSMDKNVIVLFAL